MTNMPSVAHANRKMQQLGGPSTDQVDLWVRFPVGAGPSHTKDVKNGSGSCLHGTQVSGPVSVCDWVG